MILNDEKLKKAGFKDEKGITDWVCGKCNSWKAVRSIYIVSIS